MHGSDCPELMQAYNQVLAATRGFAEFRYHVQSHNLGLQTPTPCTCLRLSGPHRVVCISVHGGRGLGGLGFLPKPQTKFCKVAGLEPRSESLCTHRHVLPNPPGNFLVLWCWAILVLKADQVRFTLHVFPQTATFRANRLGGIAEHHPHHTLEGAGPQDSRPCRRERPTALDSRSQAPRPPIVRPQTLRFSASCRVLYAEFKSRQQVCSDRS